MNSLTADKTTALIERLGDRMPAWRVLEFGPYNGRNTKVIAPHCREILALEARPENCQLIRELALPNVEIVLGDAGDEDTLDGLGVFDLIFHSGVLYHLRQPINHLQRIKNLSNRLWLNTHYSRNPHGELKRETIHGPRSGIEPKSLWLGREQLLQAVREAGFERIEIIAECVERNGPRIALYAESPDAQ